MPTHHAAKATFDEMADYTKNISQSDFLKFCKDFDMPMVRKDVADLIRRKIHRGAGK